ncbi:glycosyl transferase family 1 [Limnochorda pilosa]|uniref:Glycosyl transferase family 1 n=1 Tax=Limnochorda pilosa TaxID=1555112 RepID=A0A0K2SJ64_LIMPI|nr:glycosyl transferase family 1 [Limnochorda pilosa]
MHVLMLSWEYPPRVVGGLARAVAGLSRALAAGGVEVRVLTLGEAGSPFREEDGGVEVIRLRNGFPPAPDLVTAVAHFNFDALQEAIALSGRGFDLIHAHDWLVAYAARTLKHGFRVPLVATLHATEHGRNRGIHTPLQRYIHDMEWTLTYEAWRVILCSSAMREETARLFNLPADKTLVLPNGVEPDELAVPADEDLAAFRRMHAAPDQTLILAMGRLVPEKGFDVLLDAFRLVLDRFPRAKLVIAGEGPHRAALEERAGRLGVAPHVYFKGFAADPVRNRLLHVADVAVFPSTYEPFGIVALEAMGAGLPVVASRCGGLPEVVEHGETGLLVPAGDPAALADALVPLLLSPGLREHLGRRGRERVAARFGWRRVAERTLEEYQRVLDERRRVAWISQTDGQGSRDGRSVGVNGTPDRYALGRQAEAGDREMVGSAASRREA